MLESLPESQKALAVSAVGELMSPHAIRVLDLQLEKAIADIHLRSLHAQNEVLKAALAERQAQKGDTPAPPPDFEKFKKESIAIDRDALSAYSHYARLLDYMIRENPRENHFAMLAFLQGKQADLHEKIHQGDEARNHRHNAVVTQRRRLDWAKTAGLDEGEKLRAVYRAGTELAKAQAALASHYLKVKDFEQALSSAKDALRTLETEPGIEEFGRPAFCGSQTGCLGAGVARTE